MNIPEGHPRLFFTQADLPRFRKRLEGPYHVKPGDTPRTLIREHGFAYLMNGDAASAQTAVAAALRLCKSGLGSRPNDDFEAIFDIALCYDWCHAALGEVGERMRVILAEAMDAHHYTRAMDRGPGHNMTTENALAAVSAGLALSGEHANAAQWLADARRVVVEEAMGSFLDRLCPDGGDFEGVQYHGARYQGEAIFAWLWLKGTGENLFTPDHPHLLNGVNWWIYLLEPHLDGTHIVQGDTNHRGISARNVTSAACLSLGAGDPFSGWYASQRLAGWEAVALRPDVSKPPGAGLPLYRHFNRMGMAAIRSGWEIGPGSRDTLFTFLCRPYFQGWHCHQDVNHFTLSRRGELAIDSGVYQGDSAHMKNYSRRTIAHNALLLYDPEEPLPPGITARDGGQVFHNDDAFLRRTGAAQIGWRLYGNCDFKAFGVGPGYYYMCGDATKAYNYADFRKARLVTREVVYVNALDPPLIVIFDRVVATRATTRKTWLLHTHEQPQVSGTTITVSEGGGQLFVQSLLPHSPRITTVGGPGNEYWVADPGENYAANGRIYGRWRLEISPRTAAESDRFLTVLYPCDPGAAVPGSRLVEEEGVAGCEVRVAGNTYRILFHTTGETGGTFNGAPFATTNPMAGK